MHTHTRSNQPCRHARTCSNHALLIFGSNHFTSRYLEWSWELIFTAWKRTEDPAAAAVPIPAPAANSSSSSSSSPPRRVFALYGAGAYRRDVSAAVAARLFAQADGRLRVPGALGGGLNELFGDHVEGAVKTLRVEVTGGPGGPVVLEVSEDGAVALALE
jgi:hypothetical protein